MYVCMYARVYVLLQARVYACTCVNVCLCTNVCAYLCMFIYVCVLLCMCTRNRRNKYISPAHRLYRRSESNRLDPLQSLKRAIAMSSAYEVDESPAKQPRAFEFHIYVDDSQDQTRAFEVNESQHAFEESQVVPVGWGMFREPSLRMMMYGLTCTDNDVHTHVHTHMRMCFREHSRGHSKSGGIPWEIFGIGIVKTSGPRVSGF